MLVFNVFGFRGKTIFVFVYFFGIGWFGLKVDLKLLERIVREVRFRVRPLVGKVEAWRVMGAGAGGDQTRYIDLVAEQTVFDFLKENGVKCFVVGEETGFREVLGGNPNLYFIVDSLDGTYNVLHEIPFNAISLAVADKPKLSAVKLGVVASLTDEMFFSAEKGLGAKLNGNPIKPSKEEKIEDALVSVSFTPNKDFLRRVSGVLENVVHVRHFGANALEVCFVACGRLDAVIDLRGKLRVTDVAAASLILREAGGFIVDERGFPLDSPADSPEKKVSMVAAGNKKLLDKLLSLLGKP